VRGTAHQPVYLMPIESEISWEGVSVSGSNSLVNASHLDLRGSFLRVRSGGTCLVKDSTFRDFHRNYPIVFTDKAQFAELVRCHLARFYEVNFKQTLTQIDDCVFEYILGDGIDYDAPPFGSYMRNSTLRHGNRTNIDAMDIGEEADRTLIENCHVFDFSDKAVSIGEGSHGIIVKNSLFDQVETGVAVKDGCTAEMIGNTIVNSTYAFRLYEKNPPFGGGHATNTYNNILWNNLRGVVLSNGSTIVVHHSNIMGTTYPGEGNISADPLFRNFDWRDYRLGSG
jgi:hypothetical protein